MNFLKSKPFYKLHGAGNDFVLLDNRDGWFSGKNKVSIRKICRSHTGVGADGLMLIEESDQVDFHLKYFNADGTAGEMCGNGARCAVFLAYQLGIISTSGAFEIDEKIYHAAINDAARAVSLRMQPAQIVDTTALAAILTEHFSHAFQVEVGVPHLVLEIAENEDIANLDVIKWGKTYRYHSYFQTAGVNVNFIRPITANRLQMRVYERGVEAETLACGTGAVACAIFANLFWQWQSPVFVDSAGGKLRIDFDTTFSEIQLTGPVSPVFQGFFDADFLAEI